jgi:DNA-binding winged helix-turn-helix (wHTH) protein/tetratricopeptide (TPR) repeat protein
MQSGVGGRYRFGHFEIDLGQERLLHGGVEVALRPKAFSLLAHFVRCRGRLVSSAELLAAVWTDVAVSEATLSSTLRSVREALSQPGDGGPQIHTLRGRGYRFEAEVEEVIPPAPATDDPLGDAPSSARGEANFVGRADVLATGRSVLDEAREGRGRVLILAGEAGIGKSRALRELARLAGQRGFAVHRGRCLEEEGAPACWPWLQILRGVVERLPSDERTVFADRHAGALTLLPEYESTDVHGGAEGDFGSASERFRLFDSIAQLLRELAHGQPRAILLDDLHRADASSAQLLRHLVAALADDSVVVFGTLRGSEVPVSHPIAPFLSELHVAGSRLDLGGLDAKEVGQLIGSLWGRAPLRSVAEAVHRRSGGNPLFASEVARLLDRDETNDAPEAAAAAAPASVRQVIRARMARMSAATVRVLEMASVHGREFSLDVLRRMRTETTGDAPEPALAEGKALGFVQEDSPGSVRLHFAHILIRDALYEDLPLERRGHLHRAAGMAIEGLHPFDRDDHAEELAHHFGQALDCGEAERAQRFAHLAGERALRRAAYDEAAAHFEAALRALGRRENVVEEEKLPAWATRDRLELEILQGRVAWLAGRTEDARKIFFEAAAVAERAGIPELEARAALGYAGRTDATPGVNHTAVALMERALEALPQTDAGLRAELMARLGTELYYSAETSRSERLTREAVEIAERVDDAAVLAYALSAQHYALRRPDIDPRRRVRLTDRLAELASQTGDRDVLAIGLLETVVDRLELGDRSKLDDALRALESLASELRQPFFRWMTAAYSGMRSLLDGQVAQADQLAEQTLELGQHCSSPNALPMFAGQLFCVRREQGRLPELEPLLTSALAEQPVFTALRAGLAATQAAAGRRSEAAATLADLMVDGLDDVPRDQGWLMLLGTMTAPAVAVREEEIIEKLLTLLAPYAGRMIVVGHGSGCHGAVDHHLGLLEASLGNLDAADDHFEAAEMQHRRLRARLWLAHTQREHARALWKGGAPHDRERARELAEVARALYRGLGLSHWVEETNAGLG